MKEQGNGRQAAFRQAVNTLPLRLQNEAFRLKDEIQQRCEELRLRAGWGMSYSIAGIETSIPVDAITQDELQETLTRATRYSVHSFTDSLQQGFVTLEGGHRLGVCGAAVIREGLFAGIRNLSSVNLRIAAQTLGAAANVVPAFHGQDGRILNTLIISPPAWGKTTLLRDCIRLLSSEGIRVGVTDERCELSGSLGGVPQFNLGPTTDIISGGSKAESALLLLKTMSPAVLALDEITAKHDVDAIVYAAHCGTAVLATAHAYDIQDFKRRSLYRSLLQEQIFENLILITIKNGERYYSTIPIGGEDLC